MADESPKRSSPPLAAVEILSTGAAGVALLLFGVLALVPLALGRDLSCFPHLQTALFGVTAIGMCAFAGAALVGAGLAFSVALKKAPPTFGRLGGFAGAGLVFALLSTPTFADPIRLLFGMRAGHHYAPVCPPDGWLGNNPELWRQFSKAMGYVPTRSHHF